MLGLAALALAIVPGCAHAEFTREQIGYLTAPSPSAAPRSPMDSAGIYYHYFDAEPDAVAPPPDWLAELLPAMRKRRWKDSEGNLHTELELWQAPAGPLFEFFKLTRRTFPKAEGGQGTSPAKLFNDYEAIRLRFGRAVDRLYLARAGGSLKGRGQELMILFRKMLAEMRAINGALLIKNEDRYVDAVMEIGELTTHLLEAVQREEVRPKPKRPR